MGIQIGSATVQPAVVFDKVFLQRLSIDQHVCTDDLPPPKYKVTIEYRLYGVIGGVRHFHSEVQDLEVEDFLSLAMFNAQTGDMTLLTALPAIEAAIAKLIAIDLNTTAEVV